MSGRIELLPSEYADVVKRGEAWLAVYEPCGTPNCKSPTCQLAYAIQAALAADSERIGEPGQGQATEAGEP